MDEREAAARLAEAARRTVALGLNRGAEGNVSLRFGDGFLITPSGLPNDSLQAGQMVYMDLEGGWQGPLKPSSEWRIHRDLYRARADAGAVVHAHSPHAVSLACLRHPIPPFHYMVAAAGGRDIPCAAYATFGTEALSANVLTALADRRACLMANHGQVALGRTLEEALRLAEIVEELAAQYWRARLLGEPVLLTDAEMDEVLERFAGYGQPSAGG